MTGDVQYVVAAIVIAGLLILSGRVRLDIVALFIILSLILGEVLTPQEALQGFGDPVVIMVAGLLVVGEMLARTGVAHSIGSWLVRYGRDGEARQILMLSLLAPLLGSVMSNTAVVAIFLPIVLAVTRRTNLNASHLLLPLAYASLVSGMMTVISATPNLVLSASLEDAGFEPFGFFDFTPIGLAVLCALVIYMLMIGRHLLPGDRLAPPKTAARSLMDLVEEFGLMGSARRAVVPIGSPLIGQPLAKAEIESRYNARVILHERAGSFSVEITATPPVELAIRQADVLVFHGANDDIDRFCQDFRLRPLSTTDIDRTRWTKSAGLAKVLVHPESSLIGKTLRGIGLRSTYGVEVLAVNRKGEILNDFLDRNLESGDSMLVVGPWKRIRQLQAALHDFVVLALPAEIEEVAPAHQRAPAALAILALMVVLSAFELVPVVVAVLIASVLAVLTRCLSMGDAYRAIRWNTVVLIAGMLAIARALESSGAIALAVEYLVGTFATLGPFAMMSTLFLLTTVLSMVLSNTATAVLLAPIAIQTATALEVPPQAFAMTVAIAASAGYVIPVSSPAVMLVVGPGKYRTTDFIKIGMPMLIVTWLITIAVTPLLFPFNP